MILEHLTATLGSLGPSLKDHLWQSTVFSLGAVLVALAMRKNYARIRYWIWLTASVKFLVPFSILVSVGTVMRPHHQPAPAMVVVYDFMDVVGQPFTAARTSALPLSPGVSSRYMTFSWSQYAPTFIAFIWIIGTMSVLTTWGMYWWRIRQTIQRATKAVDGPELQALRELQQTNGSHAHVELCLSGTDVGPGAYGLRRSLLIWPSRISRRLNDEQIKSILAHELCHVERHDNLTAAIHMAVEALFWFHPLVWWLGSQLELERERACDEHVVQTTISPQTYAESILKVCELCLESPLECISGVTGGDLKERVRRIMTGPRSQRLTPSRKVFLAAIASGSIAIPVLFGQIKQRDVGQIQDGTATSNQTLSTIVQTAPHPVIQLDVISIKENRSEEEKGYVQIPPNGSRIIVRNSPMFRIIGFAFNKQRNDLIEGLPAWTHDAKWDIEATIAEESIPAFRAMPFDQQKEVLQQILKDRCQFAAHAEQKEVPVFALTIAKSGLKMKQTPTDGREPSQKSVAPTIGWDLNQSHGRITARNLPVEGLVYALSKAGLPRQVVDRTGLAGRYDVQVQWTPDDTPEPTPDAKDTEIPPPPIYAALEEQLGLKLDATRALVPAIVVTHLERPTPN
jgi:bla regulator protein BlaR1